MKSIREILGGHKFAANSKVAKDLKSSASDKELVEAVKTTKAFKESKELQQQIADWESAGSKPKEEPRAYSGRGGEPRRG